MVEIIWTEPALQDLNDIAEYIALDKVSAAERFVASVFHRVDQLLDSPKSGRRIPELRGRRYREVIVGPCRVFYRDTEGEVLILHVMRGERLLKDYLLKERDSNES